MIGGLAGDMFLAASIDTGLITRDALQAELRKVGLGEVVVHAETVKRYGMRATHVSFSGWDPEHEADHRHLSEIESMIRASGLDEGVKDRAIAMFYALGEVESKAHDIPLETVHFHEIGAIDSILDFVGAAYVLETVDATWSSGRVPSGHGTIDTSHGVMPAVAPATAKLLKGFTMQPRGIEGELVTPTGATILNILGLQTSTLPGGVLTDEGFGAGTKDFEGFANVVRLTVFDVEREDARIPREDVVRLVAEIDDETPEVLAHAEQVLLDAGALDVVRTPVTMKKGRAGIRVAVLARPQDVDRLGEVLLRQTSTFGVRIEPCTRMALVRDMVEVDTEFGAIRVKRGWLGDEILKASPEYEDCARAAAHHEVPLRRVYDATIAAHHAQGDQT